MFQDYIAERPTYFLPVSTDSRVLDLGIDCLY